MGSSSSSGGHKRERTVVDGMQKAKRGVALWYIPAFGDDSNKKGQIIASHKDSLLQNCPGNIFHLHAKHCDAFEQTRHTEDIIRSPKAGPAHVQHHQFRLHPCFSAQFFPWDRCKRGTKRIVKAYDTRRVLLHVQETMQLTHIRYAASAHIFNDQNGGGPALYAGPLCMVQWAFGVSQIWNGFVSQTQDCFWIRWQMPLGNIANVHSYGLIANVHKTCCERSQPSRTL